MHVVMYHNVVPDELLDEQDQEVLTRIPLSRFRREVALLRERHRFVGLRELVTALQRGEEIPGALAFTFDDAYRGACRHALPILEEYGVRATIFIITGCIGLPRAMLFDRLELALRRFSGASVVLGDLDPALPNLGQGLTGLRTVKTRLKQMAPARSGQLLETILRRLGQAGDTAGPPTVWADKYLPASWEILRSAAARGHEMGSHTVHHLSLARLPDAQVARELEESIQVLREQFGDPAWIPFAYPFGTPADVSGPVAQAVEKAGYCCAVTTSSGPNQVGAHPFLLRRVVLENGRFLEAS